MGKSASSAMSVFSANIRKLLESSEKSKAEIARTHSKDAKWINRISNAEHESQTDTISALAKYFGKEPWQLLHPKMGEPMEQPSVPVALETMLSAISALHQPARKALADDLALLALAPGDPETRQRVLNALRPPGGGQFSTNDYAGKPPSLDGVSLDPAPPDFLKNKT